ncbi:MAG: hypothetical protein M1816_002719 [Peltula sp. TS41687]|nr:MAG: hypothetical protein M1816_002719 [Peltula sp. TS41687]
MWRDRTNLYISYRQSYSHHPSKRDRFAASGRTGHTGNAATSEERRGLISADGFDNENGDAIIEMDLLPPRWVDISDEVTDLLADIARKITKLDRLHAKHVLPGFDDEEVRRKEEEEIEKMTQEITRGFHNCQRAIQKVDKMVRDSRQQQQGVNRAEEVMARNLQISLATRVQEASAGFRKKQSAYLKKLRGISGMTSPFDRSSTPQNAPYTDPSMIDTDADKSYSQSTLQQTSQHQKQLSLTENDAAIIQREREITDIARGIIELADIFKELQTMVIDQGTMLDRIDYNVERMAVDVKAADKELTVASGYQRKTAKRKILLLLFLLVVGMFILLLIKPKRHGHPSPSTPQPPSNDNPQKDTLTPPLPNGPSRRDLSRSEVELLEIRLPEMSSRMISSAGSAGEEKRDWKRRRRRGVMIEAVEFDVGPCLRNQNENAKRIDRWGIPRLVPKVTLPGASAQGMGAWMPTLAGDPLGALDA